MRQRHLLAVAFCLAATACADRPTRTVEPGPSLQPSLTANTCPSPGATEELIVALFPSGYRRSSAIVKFGQVVRLAGSDITTARARAITLMRLIVEEYDLGRLIGGQSAATQTSLQTLLNAILCTVGLPAAFGNGSLGDDGEVAFIFPTTQDTDVVTETQWAGVNVPSGSVTQPTVITIQRLPDSPNPLLTPLDQYPIFYEYHASPALPFSLDVVVAVCIASNFTPPDPLRLRLAHNVPPFTPGSIEILPLASAPFVDCSDAPIASAARGRGFDLARVGSGIRRGLSALLLPQKLLALPYYATGGVGGTVRTFSPFGAVDTLGTQGRASSTEFHGSIGGPADGLPSVVLTTPTGQPMAGVPVTFSIFEGGGTLTGVNTVTNASGVATVGSFTLGPVRGCTTVQATATMPAGSGLNGNPINFDGCGR